MMTDALVQALINFVAVFGGLYVLWAIAVKRMSPELRLRAAAFAGAVSAAVTFAVTAAT